MPARAAQYPLHLPTSTSLSPEDYIITQSNHDLSEALRQMPSAEVPVVLLVGPAHSGKTHLLNWLASQRPCTLVAATALGKEPASEWLTPERCTIIDGIEDAREDALAQAINHARASACPLLLSMDRRFVPNLPDLASRLRAAHILAMPEPDDALREALLHKYFADLQWRCDAGVLGYIATRLPRDMMSLQQFVARADAQGLAEKRALTIPFASRILKELEDSYVS